MPVLTLRSKQLVGLSAAIATTLAIATWASSASNAGLLPHGFCFTWFPGLLWLHVISDSLIFLAYMSIPVTLSVIVRKRADLPFNWMFQLFGLFIVACGLTHAMETWTIWHPDYWLSGTVKALTAAVSLPTALLLWHLVPKALAIPSAAQLRQANEALALEVARRERVEHELRGMQRELEQHVQARTRQLAQAEALLTTVFEAAPIGIGLWDRELRFVRLNEALARMNGIPRSEHLMRPIRDVLPDLEPAVYRAMQAVADTGVPAVGLEVTGRTPASLEARHWAASFYRVQVEGGPPMVGGVCEEITRAKELQLERARLLHEAQAAQRRKDEFLAMLGHELRNPLGPITNAHALIARTEPLTERGHATLSMAQRQTAQLGRLVDDLLETARIAQGKILLRPQVVDVESLIRNAVHAVSVAAAKRDQPLTVAIGPGSSCIHADSTRLTQVLENLLGNALKYTRARDAIRVEADGDADSIEIRVSDDGVGIEPDSLPHIFELFEQGNVTIDRAQGGLGIGLAWVRRLVELHGGSVRAESAGRGRGSTFTVRLPREGPAPDVVDRAPQRAGWVER